MAKILCKIHGASFCYSVCPHLIEDKQSNRKPGELITMSFYFGDFAGDPNCPMRFSFNYCQKCVELYNFPEKNYQFSEENLSVEEFDKKFEFASNIFELVCVECYGEFMREAKNSHP